MTVNLTPAAGGDLAAEPPDLAARAVADMHRRLNFYSHQPACPAAVVKKLRAQLDLARAAERELKSAVAAGETRRARHNLNFINGLIYEGRAVLFRAAL